MKPRKETKSTGEIVSFKLEQEILDQVRKQSVERHIPLSMWLREAAREKLAAQEVAAQEEAVLA